ncbi:MAG: molybdopterin-guanine dinucleotide biosynthesis protein B [Anaerolineales bacterium]|nr:molybdopterin-guanine dinucleotide biosynthesis protein B [Anaerolineales bacterium]
MRAVGIVGYKNSGKTTLTRALARELTRRGHEVAVIKHTSHHLDLPGKDTATLGEAVSQVGFISPQESGVFWKKSLSLENIIPYLEADILLVEGFKAEKTFPKIVCLSGQPEDENLFDGLAICAVGPASEGRELDVPLLSLDEIGKIADLVEGKAFKLPNLDCGSCGFETCYELAREIVKGTRSVEDCVSLQPATEVRIDGKLMPMNPFISSIVRSTILGMLSPLKGFKKGKVEISL